MSRQHDTETQKQSDIFWDLTEPETEGTPSSLFHETSSLSICRCSMVKALLY